MKNHVLSIKKLLAVDAFGAAVSAGLLFFLLLPMEHLFGMPSGVVRILAWVAVGLCFLSSGSYLWTTKSASTMLRIVAVANLTYCAATAIPVVLYWSYLTPLGVAYFLIEIAIVLGLVRMEWKVNSSILM